MHIHTHMHTHPYIHTKCHQTVNSRADLLMLLWFGSCCEFMLWQSKIRENKIIVSSVHHKLCFSCHAAVNKQVLFQTQGHGYRNTWNAQNRSWKWSSVSSMCLQMLYKIGRRKNIAWKRSRKWAVICCSKYSNNCKNVWTSQSLSSNNPTINWQKRHQILHKTWGKMKICMTSFDTISCTSKRSTKSQSGKPLLQHNRDQQLILCTWPHTTRIFDVHRSVHRNIFQ